MSWKFTIAALGFMAFAAQPASAHGTETHDSSTAPAVEATELGTPMDPAAEEKARAYFTDLTLVDQHGRELRFFSDVLKGHVVMISQFYTNCKEACPLTTARVGEVQDMLGDLLGHGVVLVSLTLDPERDSADAVAAYAEKFEARDGWYFLTGTPKNVNEITRRLGNATDDVRAHNTHYLIGNVPQATWIKVRPNAPAPAIVQQIRRLAGMPIGG